jgi:diguanylate cyclase (GGDEF)-like protein
VELKRSISYAMLTAFGAAVGLLLLRSAVSYVPSLGFEFFSNRLTYLYVFGVTAVVFLTLGFVLGRRIDQLRHQSTTDPLTGLPNRRAFEARLTEECRRARRYGSPLSILLIDVDGLKRVNDERGHAAGDAVLHTTAKAIKAAMRTTDASARWGGDEFAILAPNTASEAAQQLGQRLLAYVARQTSSRDVDMTVSVGVSTLEPDSDCASATESLLNAADAALYRAKAAGRNRVHVA